MTSENNGLIVTDFGLCDRDHFRIVKGISILAVLAAYICTRLLDFSYLPMVKGVAGAVFLFCSGYGVSESYILKQGLVHYWENKMMKVWVPSLVVMVLFSLINSRNAVAWVAESPLGLQGETLYLIFAAYLAFWLLFQFTQSRTVRCVALFAVAAVAFFFVDQKLLATQVFAFPVGVLFSQQGLKYKVRKFTWKGKLLLTVLLAAAAAGAWVLAGRFSAIAYVSTLLWSVAFLSAASLLIFGVFFAKSIQIFGLFAPVGTISFGLYLLYSDVFGLLKNRSDWRGVLVALALLVLAASLFTWLRFLLITWNKNMRRRKKTHLKGSMW